jgi:hypothetical protein
MAVLTLDNYFFILAWSLSIVMMCIDLCSLIREVCEVRIVADVEKDDENMFEIEVFRFMNGASCYVLDDDDEYVVVLPDKVVRVASFKDVTMTTTTRNHTGKVILDYDDVDGEEETIRFDGFFDEFEKEKFKEFLDAFVDKTDSETSDSWSDTDKDD